MMSSIEWELNNLPKIIRKRRMTLKNILYRYEIANAKHDIEQMIALENTYGKEDQLLQFNLKQLACASETFASASETFANVEAYND